MSRESASALRARYRASGAWSDQTIAGSARELLQRDGARIAYVAAERRWSLAEIFADAEALAAGLAARGLRAGDVVSFQLPNWVEVAVIDLAAALLGLVVNPIVPIYRDGEVGFMLADCRAKAVFVPDNFRGHDYLAMMQRLAPQLPELKLVASVRAANPGADSYEALIGERATLAQWPTVDPDAVKMLLYTSGTTGRPKAVLNTHNSAASVLQRAFRHWGQREGEAVLMASPVTHVTGFGYGVELPLVCGSTTVFMERWNAAEALTLIEAEGVAMTMGATPFLHELLAAAEQQGRRLPTLRTYACGGAAVPPDLIRRAGQVLERCRAFRVFGSSEAPLVTLGYVGAGEETLAAETDGQVIGYEVQVRDDEGRVLAPGEEGEICVRGASLFLGYADAEQTAASVDAEGFFATGDLGRVTADGALTISGRKKDLINRGGEKISAKEVEDLLHLHPAIEEAAVIAMPHARLGETVCVYAILRPQCRLDFAGLIAFVEEAGIARQKYPEALVIVEQLPRTAAGKVRKDQLREDVRRRMAGAS